MQKKEIEKKEIQKKEELQSHEMNSDVLAPDIDNIPEIIEQSDIEPENKRKILSVIESYSGPLPPPAMLMQYNEIPGVLDAILKMTTDEQKHRHSIENQLVNSDVKLNDAQILYLESGVKIKTRIHFFSFIIIFFLIILGFISVILDKQIYGVCSFVGAMATFCYTMFYGKKNDQATKEIAEGNEKQLQSRDDEKKQ